MSYAIWIALAVVLFAIGPALARNLRSADKRGTGGGDAGPAHPGSDRDQDDAADADSADGGSADGGGADGGGAGD